MPGLLWEGRVWRGRRAAGRVDAAVNEAMPLRLVALLKGFRLENDQQPAGPQRLVQVPQDPVGV